MSLLGAGALAALVVATLRSPRAVILTTLLFLPFLGLVRRVTGSYEAQIDPLTLVGPGVAAAGLLVLSRRQGRLSRTPLMTIVGCMLLLGLIEIFNRRQGGLSVSVLGAGLFVGPLVWFYVGHRLGDADTLDTVVRVTRVIVVIIAAYGVKQLIFGFTGFEKRWIASRLGTYAALNINGKPRPFSTFASGAEYSYYLALGAVLFTLWRKNLRRALRVVIILSLLLACFYAGSRSIFIIGTLATVAVAFVHRIRSLGRALLLCVAVGLAGIALLRLVPLSSTSSVAGNIRNRTVSGLTRPFDRKVSTLGIHIDSFTRGVIDGLRVPLGHGAATVNLAGLRAGGNQISGDNDVPNVLLAYGWAGGVLLFALVLQAYRLVRKSVRRGDRGLLGPAVFVLAVFGSWFAGELYAVSALVWFFLGNIDRQNAERSAVESVADAAVA